jgi:hypothetical protein
VTCKKYYPNPIAPPFCLICGHVRAEHESERLRMPYVNSQPLLDSEPWRFSSSAEGQAK